MLYQALQIVALHGGAALLVQSGTVWVQMVRGWRQLQVVVMRFISGSLSRVCQMLYLGIGSQEHVGLKMLWQLEVCPSMWHPCSALFPGRYFSLGQMGVYSGSRGRESYRAAV